MKGPIRLVRSDRIAEYENLGPIYEWAGNKAYLIVDQVSFRGKVGAILCYFNPPVHQVGNPGLDAYLEGLDRVFEKRNDLDFFILYGANDPVHAGGDLKESLRNLDMTLEAKKEKEAGGASPEEIDQLYEWADDRLEKGIALHAGIGKIAEFMRVVAVCGGGTRFGGSAEIPLMAGFLIGDLRSGMCFSEAMIGLIPGWSGIARTLVKAGLANAEYMVKTSRDVKADQLKEIGIYNVVVHVPFSFPKRQKTHDPEADKAKYEEQLDIHNDNAGLLLLPEGLVISTCPEEEIPVLGEEERLTLATRADISLEVNMRKDPENYSHLRGQALKDLKEEIAKIGRPLAPQSIEALDSLFQGYDASRFDENLFVEREMKLDAGLYRDPRFRAGLIAALEQRVADYRLQERGKDETIF